ncbi:NAD(P)-binding domain-containing protein [Streptomyces griseofuscus]|uniref:NAD(P)-binding domain-containing protein n=1 Tax=Streptomyces griseofuscus TaxID=146922 RepID=UPI0036F526F3
MTFGIIGAGDIGTTIAQAVIGLGHGVVLANSRGPETLTALVAHLGPKGHATTAAGTGEAADVAVIAEPFCAIYDIPVEPPAARLCLTRTTTTRRAMACSRNSNTGR